MTRSSLARVAQLEKRRRPAAAPRDLTPYAADPAGYCRDVLKVRLTPQQEAVCRSMTSGPRRVFVRGGHGLGKTHLEACLASWWYDTRPDGCVLITAPGERQIKSQVFAELRKLRPRDPDFAPSAPLLGKSEWHCVKGYTARDAAAFQGAHRARTLLIFDEAVGIAAEFWEAGDSMLAGGIETAWLANCNPTDPATPAREQERGGGWDVHSLSCVDHPNVSAELQGRPPPFPHAVRLSWLTAKLDQWATPLGLQDAPEPRDVALPLPGGVKRWRPGPVAESRLLGRWPSSATNAVWDEALWGLVLANRVPLNPAWPVQIGCDVARYGDDFTSMHVRKGVCSIHHETHNGWGPQAVASRLRELCVRFAVGDPRGVPVCVDPGGGGDAVISHADGFDFRECPAGARAYDSEQYLNARSELWFSTVEFARTVESGVRLMDVSRIERHHRDEIGRQLMAPTYTVDAKGRKVVEPKDVTKRRLKRSPDDGDALNLSFRAAPARVERVA
jgi:hypothetical protein